MAAQQNAFFGSKLVSPQPQGIGGTIKMAAPQQAPFLAPEDAAKSSGPPLRFFVVRNDMVEEMLLGFSDGYTPNGGMTSVTLPQNIYSTRAAAERAVMQANRETVCNWCKELLDAVNKAIFTKGMAAPPEMDLCDALRTYITEAKS
jgi:hypothetical protein